MISGILVGNTLAIHGDWDKNLSKDKIIILMPVPPIGIYSPLSKTTKMCLEELEKRITSKTTVLDLGAGTGILAIAAKKLGAKKVYATENVSKVFEFTEKCIAINKVKIELGENHDSIPHVDLCVANIGDQDFEKVKDSIKADVIIYISNEGDLIEVKNASR